MIFGYFFPFIICVLLTYMGIKEKSDIARHRFRVKFNELYEQYFRDHLQEQCEGWESQHTNPELEKEIDKKLLNDHEYYWTWRNIVTDKLGDDGELLMYRNGGSELLLRLIMASYGFILTMDVGNPMEIKPVNLNIPGYASALQRMYYLISDVMEQSDPKLHIEYKVDNVIKDNDILTFNKTYTMDEVLKWRPEEAGKYYWTDRNLTPLIEDCKEYAIVEARKS